MIQAQRDLLRLHLSPGIGRNALFKLRHHFGSFSAALEGSIQCWQSAGLAAALYHTVLAESDPRLKTTRDKLEALNARIVSFWDPEYPPLLRTIYDPPALLYVRGQLPGNDCFAIVGSRRATTPGLTFTSTLAAQLAEYGICIVSGLARGVDSAAHQGALEANGRTIAVLGCGIDRIYPPENARLFHTLYRHNAIISEYPLGTPPQAWNFPGRNRIISGMSHGVLIVEAAAGSGSLITADFALEQGREVFAAPGAIHHPNSQGPHQLLKDGARIVTDAADILLALWPDRIPEGGREAQSTGAEALDGATANVYRQLGETPLHHDEIARKCALTPMELSAILLDLELRGGARQLPGGHFIRGSLKDSAL